MTNNNDRVNRNIKTFLETCSCIAKCGPSGDKLETYYRSIIKTSEVMARNISTGTTTAEYVFERLKLGLAIYEDNEFMQAVLLRIEKTALMYGLMISDDIKVLRTL